MDGLAHLHCGYSPIINPTDRVSASFFRCGSVVVYKVLIVSLRRIPVYASLIVRQSRIVIYY